MKKALKKTISFVSALLSYAIIPVIAIREISQGISIDQTLIKIIIPANIAGLVLLGILIAIFSVLDSKDKSLSGAILSSKYFMIFLYELTWFSWITNISVIVISQGTQIPISFKIYLELYGVLILASTLITWIFKYISKLTA